MTTINFAAINWDKIQKIEYPAENGTALFQTLQFAGIQMRIVEYTPGYLADHWCQKGHIVHCLEGDFICEMEDSDSVSLTAGMSFIVSDNLSSHRSVSKNGAKLLIIDGDFLV